MICIKLNKMEMFTFFLTWVCFIIAIKGQKAVSLTRITDVNHKPVLQCYNAEIEEEKDRGTHVTKVQAIDEDSGQNGKITYGILNKNDEVYFSINNVTGEVLSNQMFDHDETRNQKALYLTVLASDQGRPPLADICTLKVTIIDINDNAPIFDSIRFDTELAEDLRVKSEVLRILAYDLDDGDNSRLSYELDPDSTKFNEYFRIDPKSGTIYLKKEIGKQDKTFQSVVTVRDHGSPPKQSTAEIKISVVESSNKPPEILVSQSNITIKEDRPPSDDSKPDPLIDLNAFSNALEQEVNFYLLQGKTSQTNRNGDFILMRTSDTTADIRLARRLDYEQTTEYHLTIRVSNKNRLHAQVNVIINVEDVNDELPSFIESLRGSVVENIPAGQQALTVRAIDRDGTKPNNDVYYELLDHTDQFEINRTTGVMTTLVQFDREAPNGKSYFVNVRAYDGGTPSKSNQQGIEIVIEDQNDNSPKFLNSLYIASDISELASKGQLVIEVRAEDIDTESLISYDIIEGDENHDFVIEDGRIRVNKELDFEKIEQYSLTVKASDGDISHDVTTKVLINIINENDVNPIFDEFDGNITIKEEEISTKCELIVRAIDPDIKNSTADQKIVYNVTNDFLSITSDGCIKIVKKLDREDSPFRQSWVTASDNNNIPKTMSGHHELTIILIDINDNAPVLNMTDIVYYENQEPSFIVRLEAIDYDTPENGPPFTYKIADSSMHDLFRIEKDELFANKIFDREERTPDGRELKYYDLQIEITDSGTPQQSAISVLRVIIGDRNDNPAKDGASEIFVNKYEDLQTSIAIGRVYVDDLDDWDLDDKTFLQDDPLPEYFEVDPKGMISMGYQVQPGVYYLTFKVTEEHEPEIQLHTVYANVTVTVKNIPKEAVLKSGSIRLSGITKEEFVEKDVYTHLSKKDLLQIKISEMFNTSLENVDVFTVLNPRLNKSLVDVRFSAHGSPYYAPEKLNHRVVKDEHEFEKVLGVTIEIIGIDECLVLDCKNQSCLNDLKISNTETSVVFTNRTSFVGVKAETVGQCVDGICPAPKPFECLNNGTINGLSCSCPDGFDGPQCESTGIGFTTEGWAIYEGISSCRKIDISFDIVAQTENGLIFYAGPLSAQQHLKFPDFISLEIYAGYLLLKMDLGNGSFEIPNNKMKITDGNSHRINLRIGWNDDVEIRIDELSSNYEWRLIDGNKMGSLMINGPLQIGGRSTFFSDEEEKLMDYRPANRGLIGCVRNFTYNGKLYNLGFPSESLHATSNCNFGIAQAVTLGIDPSFLVAILVCIAILLILLLAVVVHKRQQDNQNEKDLDDPRENIINYEDEGGGECDADFDMSVFNKFDEKPIMDSDSADISLFLDNKKHSCDKDNLPYDDVRHYGYEGDGNTSGSLSSLASGTDDTDCDMNYLSSFGPRFRKLADMYGDDASEEEPNGDGESWC